MPIYSGNTSKDAGRGEPDNKPDDGDYAVWQADGTGYGSDGDIILASTINGVTKRFILFNYSEGVTW